MIADLLIVGGTVVDGTGRPGYPADVAIRGGKISDVAMIGSCADTPTLDARGLVVAPGFIDIHSHSDFTLTVDARAVSAVAQGVTLELVGNCGHGCAPVSDPALVKANLYGYQAGYDFAWKTVGEYLRYLEAQKPAINVAALVPNGNLRLACPGPVDRPATPDELRCMTRLLGQGLEEGAVGFSTGLEYSIERGCSEEEIQELCRVTRSRGGLYATHTRNRLDKPEETIAEAIRAAEVAGVSLQISHIGSITRLSKRSRWALEQALEQVDRARSRGLDVGFDMQTRLFGTTNLSSILPPWALEGGKVAIADRLKDPSVRKELRRYPSIVTALARGDWRNIVVFESKAQPGISRRSIAEISQERDQDPFDTIYDLLLTEIDNLHALMILAHVYRADEVQIAYEHPACGVGSDAVALAPDGPLRSQSLHGAYTWAAWFLRYFVNEKKLLSLEEAVRRITSLPASRLRFIDRGVIAKGACADVAIFDPNSFAEKGTTFEPNQLATGMKHVVVNGVVTLLDGERLDNRAGQVLRAH